MIAEMNMLATHLVLAQAPTTTPESNQNSTGSEFGKAGPIGMVIVLLLLIGVILLIRSMNRHVRKLPASFDAEQGPASTTPSPPEEGKSQK